MVLSSSMSVLIFCLLNLFIPNGVLKSSTITMDSSVYPSSSNSFCFMNFDVLLLYTYLFCPSGQGYGFSSSHIWMWELDCEESWAPKNWCFWTVVLEKTLESSLDCKEIQTVYPKGDQSWVFFGRTDAKAETPVLWSPHAKSWPIGKDSDAGRDWEQEEKGRTEDEMAGWHHWLDGHEFEWTLGVGDGQGLGLRQFMGSQKVRYDWATELNWLIKDYYCLLVLTSLSLCESES